MKRQQQRETNGKTIAKTYRLILLKSHRFGYRQVVMALNSDGYRTSRGNLWTPKRLFRMLQREGISGLHGLRKGYFQTP